MAMSSYALFNATPGGEPIRSPLALCTTYEGHDPTFLESVLPYVDYIEVTPDSIAEYRGDDVILHAPTIAELKAISEEVKIIVHGVGLSIGSHEGYSQRYIRLLDDFLEQVDVAWHSEHLAYTTVDGEHLGTMLALPKTEQALDLICERVCQIQDRYGLPFLLENVVHLLPEFMGDYSEAGFLNALTARTSCGLLLDVYNLECDVHNNSFDANAFFDELQMDHVRELHLACGTELHGFMVDVHTRPTRASTIALAQQVIQMASNVQVVTYELLPEAVPILGYDAIASELRRLRQHLV